MASHMMTSLPVGAKPVTATPKTPTAYPRISIAGVFISIFISFIILLSIAAHYPTYRVWEGICVVGSNFSGLTFIGFLVLAGNYIVDRLGGLPIYRPNLGNTVIVAIITIPLFTGLYLKLWYPQLREDVLVTTNDLMDNIQFPFIALFQRKDWTSQANLRSRHGGSNVSGSKCYLGWYNDKAPACVDLPPETLGNTTQCTCHEFWYNNDQVIEDFEWMNASYRYVAFDSPSWFLCNTPTYLFLLQTFFDYNVAQAIEDSSTYNPSLLMAVYDPVLGMQKAFEQGYTRMNLINANGIVAVNIGIRVRQAPGQEPAYDYPLTIASSPAVDLVSDTSNTTSTYQYPCHVSLFITVPNFERTTTIIQKQMSWSVSREPRNMRGSN